MTNQPKSMTSLYATVILLSSLIAAGGNILAANWTILFPAKSPTELEGSPAPTGEADKPLEDADWQILAPNVVYRAESNGFVATYSGGTGKVRVGVIREGPAADNLSWRTRFTRYDGTVLPILKGRYWMVEARGEGDNNSITVQWLPMR